MRLLRLGLYMESWEVAIVGAGPAALRAAIASIDSGASTILIDSEGIGSRQGNPPIAGIAASIGEINSIAHRDDTINAGGHTTNKVSAARTCGEAITVISELERWGLVFRRNQDGLPHVSKAPGHSKARLTGCGDASVREITRILEEQVIKRKITRRYDSLAISLISDNKQIRGLTLLDTTTGQVNSIQSKAVILATEGYEGLWTNPSEGAGTGAALVANAGIDLVGMMNFPKHPLSVKGTNMHIPIEVLDAGGRIRKANGDDAEPSDIEEENCVLDLRGFDSDAKIWFSNIISGIKNRTGLDINVDVIPISAKVITTGGAPVDSKGRVTFNDGKMWFTGLYAAGRSSNNGMHGAGALPGNIFLEDLTSGQIAGSHASLWALKEEFANSILIQNEEDTNLQQIKELHNPEGKSVGQISASLNSLINNIEQDDSESSLITIRENLAEINNTGIKLTDTSKIMNTELATAIQLKGLISIMEQIIS